jgi:hypothetical protein
VKGRSLSTSPWSCPYCSYNQFRHVTDDVFRCCFCNQQVTLPVEEESPCQDDGASSTGNVHSAADVPSAPQEARASISRSRGEYDAGQEPSAPPALIPGQLSITEAA